MLTTWGNHLKEFGKKFQATIMKLAKRMLSMHELVISIRGRCARNWKFHFSTTLFDFLPISKCFMFCFNVTTAFQWENREKQESMCQNLSLECPCMVQNTWIVKVRIKCLRAHWPLKSDRVTQEEYGVSPLYVNTELTGQFNHPLQQNKQGWVLLPSSKKERVYGYTQAWREQKLLWHNSWYFVHILWIN